jgi:hypothetical protein
MARPREDRIHRAGLGDAAGIHHHGPVADIGNDRNVVGDQDHRDAEHRLKLAQLV